MQNKYFKTITNIFKSKLEIERDLATQHFYDSFKSDTIKTDLVDLILSYYKSGFKIDKSHKKYIGKQSSLYNVTELKKQDPFNYIWLKIVLNAEDIVSNNQHLSNDDIKNTLSIILKDMIEPKYKQYLSQKTDQLLIDFDYFCDCKNVFEYDFTDIVQKFFYDIDIMKSYFNTFNTFKLPSNIALLNKTIGSIEFIEFPTEQMVTFRNIQADLKHINTVSEKVSLDKNKKNEDNNTTQQVFDINKLSLLYNKPSPSIEIEIKENLHALTALKKAGTKFTDKEASTKELSINIFNTLDNILNFPKLYTYKEPQRYITNLVTEYLPDIFNNYFELPENYRTSSTDKNNPQQVMEEILTEVDNKLVSISEEIFQDNVTNLNIKKRFIKAI